MRTTRTLTLSAAAAPSLFSLFTVGASSPGGGLGGSRMAVGAEEADLKLGD